MTTALAEPVEHVRRGWTASLSLANVAIWVGWYGPLQILLARQAEDFAPGTGMSKETLLAWATGAGAVVSLAANPLFGALSDRTTARWGRRSPWIVAGAAGGALSLLLLAGADGLWTMAAAWCLVQLTLNAAFAAVTAAVPDRVPRLQRGTVGGWLGAAQILGAVVGTGLATAAGGIAAGYAACAVFTLAGVLPYVLLHRDLRLAVTDRPAWSSRSFVRGFWLSPRRHPDFAWAWLTRFLINLSNALVILYLLYYLRDRLHHDDPEQGVLILTAVNSVTLLATVVVGGAWSDRVGRRKPFVLWSGVLMAAATGLLAGWQTWPSAIVVAALLGLGLGVFMSVDFALMTDVLPTALDRGKDLGVINVANALPQVAAPALAAPIVTHLGGYRVLYVVAAVAGLAGAVLVGRIKGVD
ncbi:major facilitator superfamily protein [Streptomyces lincolnensis]|uniref:Major facilitator superfamily protein n=1 Tax=Streptomyces lincolnensis TaxID=1915 RepID=A0A1B1M9L9_STRLN|nr:MFS transporter [Streptomyces lincolnensis]ANS65147.1 major facilitator superfamily protein [Streptomyces lincolnensis]AXG56645.1 major facilitator superfamily protein [Streptomyces lincolnensis]QMV06927.1 MFS transporter [Streptomyces lincolnensis]